MSCLIGIGGPSRAGKTTLAKLLAEKLRVTGFTVYVIHQDEYVVSETELPLINEKRDWEVPTSIKWDRWYKALEEACSSYDMVIAEGLHCFYYQDDIELFDKKIYVSIPKSLFISRKEVDVRWGSEPEPKWYIEYIWEAYLKYRNTQLTQEDIVEVSGAQYFNVEELLIDLELDDKLRS